MTVSHDHAGNMIDDGTFRYVYDAWNRLVAVKSSTDSGAVTIQTAEFDARGRRMKKVVTNSGDFDGTVVYLFDGHKIIETRDGSDNVVQQFIHGTRYIDELVMMRAIDKGDLYIHQDANWNVIALTDLGGSVVERYVYTPYGEVTVHQETSYGDRDGDQDVDATDKGTPGSTCTGTVSGACRILDLDFDGDYDAADASEFDNLAQGLSRHPARTSTGVHQPFAHQGLLYEPELGSYQNRARQYDPGKRRFVQRDPFAFAFSGFSVPFHYWHGTNLFEYASGDPFMWLDPSGMSSTVENWNKWVNRLYAEAPLAGLDFLLHGQLPQYGNYCSPDLGCITPNWMYPSNCATVYIPGQTSGTCHDSLPIDYMDLCCAMHDACYWGTTPGYVGWFDCHYDWEEGRYVPDHSLIWNPFGETQECDAELCRCLDNLIIGEGTWAWHYREMMRVVFFCDIIPTL